MSPIPPGAGNSFGFPWPSSWPSSPAPRKGPEPAAPSNGCPLGLREGEPDSLPVRTSSASPVKGIGSFRSHIESNYERNRCPVKDNKAYLAGRALGAESVVFRRGRGGFSALEQHPPGIFVRHVKEPAQGRVLCRIKLPHVETPSLVRENPADEHDLDHIDKPKILVHQGLETGLESCQLLRTTP